MFLLLLLLLFWLLLLLWLQIAISRDAGRRAKLSLGNIMYSAKFFRDNTKGIRDTFQSSVYTNKATTPAMPWLDVKLPAAPSDVTVTSDNVITWTKVCRQ